LAGVLANRRQEKFCLLFVEGKTQAAAYLGAGYKTTGKRSAQVCAQRLLRDVAIHRRIGEMQRQAVVSTEITVASLLSEAADIQRAALRKNNHSAAVAALTAKAKIAGLWVERSETENVNLNYVICDTLPSEAQWEAERIERDQPLAITNHKVQDEKG
jgi:phage terminase small subunit